MRSPWLGNESLEIPERGPAWFPKVIRPSEACRQESIG